MVGTVNPPKRGDVVWLDFDPQTGSDKPAKSILTQRRKGAT